MREIKAIILTRYLLLLSHLVLVITILTSRDLNVKAGLPYIYKETEYAKHDYDFVVDLSLSIAFVVLELITFGSGLTMFSSLPTVISIGAHFLSTVLLAFFVLEEVDSRAFWYVFGFGNCLPVIFDLSYIFLTLCSGRMKYT